ncbi:hypothetical protein TCAL_11480 [Tigriopus californicus]|uniref:Secreted protein n=1 Tax=Tigriopus californicus TaxID=6832 RepID=A0A553NP05_TIGCA|nr:uncharacterized protein LOC131879493 [Tigriopus californicus]TRY67165.1 hypothetical protein TCAL_11480 [Tigriopus californicus]|eukprot:TCALIF_11480-PA protein Name:"Protein of unknown function" AED:0.00 eAED:0.00 QI:636/1/1/1/1/1/3/63/316
MKPFMSCLILGLVIAMGPVKANEGDVTCTVSEYVKVGLEFDACQEVALSNLTDEQDPCPILKSVANECATNVKHCFTTKGWIRGRKLFFDSLALTYPDMNNCEIITDLAKDHDLAQIQGRKCSIAQEIVVAQETARCTNLIQMDMVTEMQKPVNETAKTQFQDLLCNALQKIKDECVDPNLRSCYEGHDLKAHTAYMVETLKVSGNVIAIHLAQDTTDVPSCPVFFSEPYLYGNDQSSGLVLTLILIMAVLVAVIVVAAVLLSIKKFRLIHRIRAWVANIPYEDFVKETAPETPMESRSDDGHGPNPGPPSQTSAA